MNLNTKTLTRGEALAMVAKLKTIREAAALIRHWRSGANSSLEIAVRAGRDTEKSMQGVRAMLRNFVDDLANERFDDQEDPSDDDDTGLTCPTGWITPDLLPKSIKVRPTEPPSDDSEAELGAELAKTLGLKRNKVNRWDTKDGDKTDMGLARTIRRLIAEHDNPPPKPLLHERVQTIAVNLERHAYDRDVCKIGGGMFDPVDLGDAAKALKALPELVKAAELLLDRSQRHLKQHGATADGLANCEALAGIRSALQEFRK